MDPIKVKAVINFAKPYRVAEGGTTNVGITINYLMTDTLKPYCDEVTQTYGYKSTKSSLPLDQMDNLPVVPGLYELDCEIGVNSQNQPQLKPLSVTFLKNVDFIFSDSLTSDEKEAGAASVTESSDKVPDVKNESNSSKGKKQ